MQLFPHETLKQYETNTKALLLGEFRETNKKDRMLLIVLV